MRENKIKKKRSESTKEHSNISNKHLTMWLLWETQSGAKPLMIANIEKECGQTSFLKRKKRRHIFLSYGSLMNELACI